MYGIDNIFAQRLSLLDTLGGAGSHLHRESTRIPLTPGAVLFFFRASHFRSVFAVIGLVNISP
jgi:hypothetical protein